MQLRLIAAIALLTISIQVESFGAATMERNKILKVEKSFLYTEYSQDGKPVNRMYPVLLNNPETKSDAAVSLGILYPGIGFTGVGLAMMGYSAAAPTIGEDFDRDFLMFGTGVFVTGIMSWFIHKHSLERAARKHNQGLVTRIDMGGLPNGDSAFLKLSRGF